MNRKKKFHALFLDGKKNSNYLVTTALSFSILLAFAYKGLGQVQATDTYTVTGTWTAQTGVTSVTVTCWGGGGAGGGASGNPAAGGGGAGGSCVTSILPVIPATVYPVTVGSVKTATATSSAVTNKGNPSWFNTIGTIYAEGGDGGNPASVNNTNGSAGIGNTTGDIGTTVYAGGSGAAGIFTSGTPGGAGGGGAGSTGTGGNAVAGTGGTGTTLNGGNGAIGVGNSIAGAAGFNYGGGGSGGKANTAPDRAGGTGAQGLVTITYIVNNAIFNGGTSDGSSVSCVGALGAEVPLPIELLFFDAVLNNNKVDLTWATASETNNDFFSIERSSDALIFSLIDIVDGAGTSTQLINYYDADPDPLSGISYYRLKQTDFSGGFSYSAIVPVNFNGIDIIIAYPNPASNQISFLVNTHETTTVYFDIYSSDGKQAKSFSQLLAKGLNTITISIATLHPSVYTLKARSENNIYRTQKMFLKSIGF